jgi:hypothetical protein
MERRVRKAIPEPQQFSLEIHPEFGEREAITDVMKPLRGVTKAKAMRDFPEQFQPKHNSTFFNFDQLPLGFRNKPILMSQEDMGSHGKSFYFHFGGGWYVQCQLRLHGHYEKLLALGYLDAAVTDTASKRKESQLARQLPVYAVALRKPSGGPASYMYTVICEAAMKRILQSCGAAVETGTITYLDGQDAWTKGTDARRGIQEIGIASFMGNNLIKKAELAAVKPQPIREGKVGRPRKSKIPAHHSTYRGIQKDGRYEVVEPVGPAIAELDAMDLDTVELQENGLLGPDGLQEPFGVAEGDEMELEGLEALNRFPLH